MEYLELLANILPQSVKFGPEVRDPVVTFAVLYFARQASKIVKSVNDLNDKIAKVIDRVDSHERRITSIEDRNDKPSQ